MNGTPDMITAGLKMIASLGVVLAMILVLLYGVRRLTSRRLGASGGKRIHVLESHYMGVKKTISLVRVPGKVLVLGISGDRINLLDTLDDDLVQQETPPGDSRPFGPILSDRLKKIGSGFKRKEDL
jgi:flagellar protein FliO/FliZ